jgi:hypothetical protein
VPVVSARYGASGDTLVLARRRRQRAHPRRPYWPVERGVLVRPRHAAGDQPSWGPTAEQVFTLSENNRGAVWRASPASAGGGHGAGPPVELAFDGAGRLLAFDGAGEGRIFRPDGALALRAPSATIALAAALCSAPAAGAPTTTADRSTGCARPPVDAIEAVLWGRGERAVSLRAYSIVHVPTEVRRDVRLAAAAPTLAAVAGGAARRCVRSPDGRQLAMLVAPAPVHDLAFESRRPAPLAVAAATAAPASGTTRRSRARHREPHRRLARGLEPRRAAARVGGCRRLRARVGRGRRSAAAECWDRSGRPTDEMLFLAGRRPSRRPLARTRHADLLGHDGSTRAPLADALALADRSAFPPRGDHPGVAPADGATRGGACRANRRTRQLLAMVLDRRYHEAALGFAEAQSSQDGPRRCSWQRRRRAPRASWARRRGDSRSTERTGAAPARGTRGDRLVTIEEIRRRYELARTTTRSAATPSRPPSSSARPWSPRCRASTSTPRSPWRS